MQLCIQSCNILCIDTIVTRMTLAHEWVMTVRKVQVIWNYIWINYNIKINGIFVTWLGAKLDVVNITFSLKLLFLESTCI